MGKMLTASGPAGYFWAFLFAGSCYLILLGVVHLLMPTINHLQTNLKNLNAIKERKERPVFQYIILLDLADVSIQHVVCELDFDLHILLSFLCRMLI